MLLLFHEYRIDHPRFSGHLRVAIIMALIVPLCSILMADAIGWWNPWLWSGSGTGIALALMLASMQAMHRKPPRLSRRSQQLVANSSGWFPYFFVIVQGLIAALIVLFMWFSSTAMALPMPAYIHAIALAMAMMIPARRYVSARILPGASIAYSLWRERLRGTWHAFAAIIITRVIIGITQADLDYITQGVIAWQTILWVPAALYIIFSTSMMLEELKRIRLDQAVPASTTATNAATTDRL